MSRLYSVINMDIMNSRNIKDRESIQNDIKTYLTSISKKYQKILFTMWIILKKIK